MTDHDPASEFLDLTDVGEGYIAHEPPASGYGDPPDTDGFDLEDGEIDEPDGRGQRPAPEPPKDTDGVGECRVCGAPTFRPPGLTPTGRKKRTPKYCDLHTRDTGRPKERPDAAGVGDRRVGPETELRNTQQSLADELKLAAVFLVPLGYPVTSVYTTRVADPMIMALLSIFRNSPNALRLAHTLAQLAPAYTFFEGVAGIALSTRVDKQLHDPYSSVARHLRVNEAFEEVYGQHTATGPQPGGNGMGPTMAGAPPPHFAGVS